MDKTELLKLTKEQLVTKYMILRGAIDDFLFAQVEVDTAQHQLQWLLDQDEDA